MKRLVIDGDEIVYKVGTSSEMRVYTARLFKDGKLLDSQEFKYIADAKEWLGEIGEGYTSAIEKVIYPAEEWIINANLNKTLSTIMSDVIGSPEIWLSGGKNFRIDVATLQPYKGNRDGAAKPHCYKDLEDILVQSWGAKFTDGIEADDALGIAGYSDYVENKGDPDKCQVVMVSQDKDLDMIPGWHYSRSKGLYWINEAHGSFNFFKQLLMGDSSDHIPGIYQVCKHTKMGPKTAEKLLFRAGYPQGNECFDIDEATRIIYEEYFWEYYWSGADWDNPDDLAYMEYEVEELDCFLHPVDETYDIFLDEIDLAWEQADDHIIEIAALLWIMRDYR